MKTFKSVLTASSLFALAMVATGCGKAADVTIGSDPVKFTGAVSALTSPEGLSDGAMLSPEAFDSRLSSSTLTDATEFKFCVARVKLEGEDDQPVKKDGEVGENGEKDPDDIRFAPGLITITDNTAVDWGKVNIPVGFKLKRIKVKVKKDKNLCGVDYSVDYNGNLQTEDIEFKFLFSPALDLSTSTDAIQLNLDKVVSALRTAASLGGTNIKSIIEANECSARKK